MTMVSTSGFSVDSEEVAEDDIWSYLEDFVLEPENWNINIYKSPWNRERTSKASSILECIGSTPLIRIKNLVKRQGIKCQILVKCEYLNPSGSGKDRVALGMVEHAERQGKLKRGISTIIVPDSASLSISVAMIGIIYGYKVVPILGESTPQHKVSLLHGLGAKVFLTPEASLPLSNSRTHPESPWSYAQRMVETFPNCFILDENENEFNALTHYSWTGAEVLQPESKFDMLVCGVCSGGTITGIGARLKLKNPNIKIIGVEPSNAKYHFGKTTSPSTLNEQNKNIGTMIENMGKMYDDTDLSSLSRSMITEFLEVEDSVAFRVARRLIQKEGIRCGPSGGAVMAAAIEAINKRHLEAKSDYNVLVIISDSLNQTDNSFLSDEWMVQNSFYNELHLSKNCWWHAIQMGCIEIKCPSIVTVDSTISDLMRAFESNIKEVIIVENLDYPSIVGLVSESKMKKLEDLEVETILQELDFDTFSEKFITVATDCTLGRLAILFQETEHIIVTTELRKLDDQDNIYVTTVPVGVTTFPSLLHWVYKIEGHHEDQAYYAKDAESDIVIVN